MEIQGTKEQIESVIHTVINSKFIRVRSMDVKDLEPETREYDFRILR